MKEKGHHIMLDAPTSLVARSARTGHSVNVSNVREAADWLPNLLLPDTYSEMAVPIVLPGENYVVGVLDVQSDKIAGLDETDASLLRTLASQVAVAINNARLFDQAETALAEAHSAQSRYTEQVWQKARVLSQAGEFRFVRPGFAAIPEEEMINLKQQTLTQAGLVVHESGANATDQTGQNVGPAVTDIGPVITAPVTLHQKSIGVVQLFPVESDQIWPDDDLAIVEAVVDELAQTAENLRLFEETRQRASFESTVGEISGLIRQAPTLDALAKSTAEALGKVLGVSSSLVRIGFSPEQESDIPGPGRPQNGKHS
jgi:GAF domain-containing protein